MRRLNYDPRNRWQADREACSSCESPSKVTERRKMPKTRADIISYTQTKIPQSACAPNLQTPEATTEDEDSTTANSTEEGGTMMRTQTQLTSRPTCTMTHQPHPQTQRQPAEAEIYSHASQKAEVEDAAPVRAEEHAIATRSTFRIPKAKPILGVEDTVIATTAAVLARMSARNSSRQDQTEKGPEVYIQTKSTSSHPKHLTAIPPWLRNPQTLAQDRSLILQIHAPMPPPRRD